MFPEGEITDPNVLRGYRGVGTVGVGLYFGFLRVLVIE